MRDIAIGDSADLGCWDTLQQQLFAVAGHWGGVMGLDVVELVLSIEERFGIDIPNEDAAKLTTPRKLIDHVCARVGATSTDKCISQRSFYRVRRVLASVAGASARQIRPSTPLENLLPARTRRKVWPGVARQIGVRRGLRRPRWVVSSIIGLCGVAFFAAFRTSPAVRVLAGLAAAGCLGGALAFVTAPLAVRLDMTAGDLARAAIPAVLAAGERSGRPQWTREAVAETCRLLIREQLGLGEFSDDADFIRDLGLG